MSAAAEHKPVQLVVGEPPELRDPCKYEGLMLPYLWISFRDDIEELRDPNNPRGASLEVDVRHEVRYRAVRAEVMVPGFDTPFAWILIYAPLYNDQQTSRWLGVHEKVLHKKGATFHEKWVETD